MKIILWLGLSILAGWLYRRGGTSKGTKWRDLGVPCVATVYIILTLGIKVVWWANVLHFGLLFGALTAYWGLDEKKWGYWAHGLGISLAVLPVAYITGHWLGFGIRCIVNTFLITLISQLISIDWLEEGLRGFSVIATMPLLLL